MSPSDHQPPKPSATPGGTSEKRQSIKKTVDTGPVFAAALERLNRRSMIALIEEVMKQISDHCDKIGIAMEQNMSINIAYKKLHQHLDDLRVTNNICITEINNIKQEIISLHAHIPCISVIEKIEELNIKIDNMSEKHPHNPPPPQRESKTAWCSSCLCAAAFVLAAAALAIILHTEYHRNVQPQAACQQQGQDRLAVIESRLKQLEEQQTRQSSSQIAAVSVIESKVTALEAELKRIVVVLNADAKQADTAAGQTQKKQEPSQIAAVSALEAKVTALEAEVKRLSGLFNEKTDSDEPLPPSTVTLVTLETKLNMLTALFQKFQQQIVSHEQSIVKLEALFRQQTVSYEQTIIKMEKCCPATSPEKKPDEEQKTIVNIKDDVTVLTGVNFATDSSTLNEDAKKILTQVAVTLKSAKFSGKRFEVAGHTDNIGDDKKNEILSQNRANAVRKFLIAQGIRQELLTSKGYGPSKPVADNATPEGQAKNRRVELDKQ